MFDSGSKYSDDNKRRRVKDANDPFSRSKMVKRTPQKIDKNNSVKDLKNMMRMEMEKNDEMLQKIKKIRREQKEDKEELKTIKKENYNMKKEIAYYT
ncbi:hypothetical protein ILUMI_18553, partial [Ignelater luminosus]